MRMQRSSTSALAYSTKTSKYRSCPKTTVPQARSLRYGPQRFQWSVRSRDCRSLCSSRVGMVLLQSACGARWLRSALHGCRARVPFWSVARAAEPVLHQPVEGERSWAGHCDPERQDDISPLLESEQITDPVQVLELRDEDGDGHHSDQRDRRQPAEEPDEEQRAADELGRCNQDRVESRRGNAQLGEEVGHLVEAVQFAPSRTDEHDTERQARQRGTEKGEALGDGENAGLQARDEVHRFAPES